MNDREQQSASGRFEGITTTIAALAAMLSAVTSIFAYMASDRANQISMRQIFLHLDQVYFNFIYDPKGDHFTVTPGGNHIVKLSKVWVRPVFSASEFHSTSEVMLPVRDNREIENVKKLVCHNADNKPLCDDSGVTIWSFHVRYTIEDYADGYEFASSETTSTRFGRSQDVRVDGMQRDK